MSKKYRLEIPENMLRWVEPELRKRQGKIQEFWEGDFHTFGWLTEIKGPLSFDEWDKSCPSVVPSSLNYQIPQSELDKFVDLHRRLGWNACLENQKLEKEIKPSCPLYVDYEKSCSAFKERIKELEK